MLKKEKQDLYCWALWIYPLRRSVSEASARGILDAE
jgi:hypothetical protein